MAHYAIIDLKTSLVISVFVGRDEHDIVDGVEDWEVYYTPPGAICRRTSYNTLAGAHKYGGQPYRKNYAGVGYIWDEQRDAFIPPKIYQSWILNEETCVWEAPTPYPQDGESYFWDEETVSWMQYT